MNNFITIAKRLFFYFFTLAICNGCNEDQVNELKDSIDEVLTTYTVHFDTDGGSYIAPVNVSSGSTLERPSNPTLTDYTFGDWYNSEKKLTVWDFDTPIVEDITLYAKWYLHPQIITFETNGGSTISQLMVEYNDTLSEPTDPIWDGYTFDGWYSDSKLTTEWNFDTSITENITLYAKWHISYPTVTFESNGGLLIDPQTIEYNTTVLEPTSPTKDGYTFDGWYSDSELTTEWDFEDLITQNTTLYAKWLLLISIYNKSDLEEFRELINNGNGNINATLMGNIDLSGDNWTPIGTSDDLFSGIFDGNNYTISNLTIDNNDNYQGLFGYVEGGSIYNLIIKTPQIKGGKYTGAVCGYMRSDGLIDNCIVKDGYVSAYESTYYIGGIVGRAYSSSVINCGNTCIVSGVKNAGGVAGDATGSYLKNCYNKGNISGIGENIGGVVGFGNYVISCFNTGAVSGEDNYVGGIAGTAAYATSCYNKGVVSGSKYTGGVVGVSYSIVSSYNTALVSGTSYVGGITGTTSPTNSGITNASYNIGKVSGTTINTTYVGGIIGYVGSTVLNCYYLPIASVSYNSKGTSSSNLISTMTSESIISTLNTAAGNDYWTFDTNNINDGYPILLSIDYE